MKAFSSSILADTNYSSPEILKESYTSFKEMKDTRESMFIRLLQFDEAAAIADMDSTRDFYISLLKMCNDNKDPKFDAAYQAIFGKYDAVFAAAKALNTEDPCCGQKEKNSFDLRNKLKTISNSVTTTVPIICDKVTTPTPVYSEAYYGVLREYCKRGIEQIKNGSFDIWDYGTDIVSDICEFVSKSSGINVASTINEFITNFNDAIKYEPSEISIASANDVWYRACGRIRDCKGYMNIIDIDRYAMVDAFINTMKVNADKLNINKVRSAVNTICDAISTYAILDAKMRDIINKHCEYIEEFNTKSIMKFLGTSIENSNISVRESMEIFGDEITSKSLFDDLDPEDFNRTEFMDLSLVAEHVLEMDKIHGRKYAIALEASLLAQGKYDELYKVNEAIGQSIKNGVSKLIEAVKKIVDKFVEFIMGNFRSEKAYLMKYKNAILNNKVNPQTKIVFHGEILEAMGRLKPENFKIPTTSYNELMSANPQQFESTNSFLDAHRQDFGLTGFNINNYKGVENLSDGLKYYYGFKQENYSRELQFKDLNIQEIYTWLLDTEKEAGKLRREVKNIDRTYNNYQASAKQYAGDRKPQSENYYSAIYDTYLTEVDITRAEQPSTAPKAADNSSSAKNDTSVSNNNNTNTQMTRGDTDKEVQATKDDESKIVKNMEIYTNTCKAVISARATGYQYVHKELMSIIRFIVKEQFGASADIKYTQPNETKANNGGQQPSQTPKPAENKNTQPEGASQR